MKRDVVDVAGVPLEGADEGEVGGVPELDEVIVATGRELPAIGTDDDVADPAVMSVDDAFDLRRSSIRGPDAHLAVVIAGEKLAVDKRQPAHPAAMAGERNLGAS